MSRLSVNMAESTEDDDDGADDDDASVCRTALSCDDVDDSQDIEFDVRGGTEPCFGDGAGEAVSLVESGGGVSGDGNLAAGCR